VTHSREVVLQAGVEKESVGEENVGKLVKKPVAEKEEKQEEESERVAGADNRFIYIYNLYINGIT